MKECWTLVGALYAKVNSNVDDHVFAVQTDMVEERYAYKQPTTNWK